MRIKIIFGACLPVGVLAVVLLQGASLQNPQSDGKKEECSIRGSVTKAGTNEPLKKARVTLYKRGARETEPETTVTDAAGGFAIHDVEPGQYTLIVDRPGYVSQRYGQKTPDGPGAFLTLSAGQQLKDLIFRLLPIAVIAGRIADEDGEPVRWVDVRALRQAYEGGKRHLVDMRFASTNDLGEYRLFDLGARALLHPRHLRESPPLSAA